MLLSLLVEYWEIPQDVFSRLVTEDRLRRQMTLEAYAEFVGVSMKTLDNIGTGKHKTSQLTLSRMRSRSKGLARAMDEWLEGSPAT